MNVLLNIFLIAVSSETSTENGQNPGPSSSVFSKIKLFICNTFKVVTIAIFTMYQIIENTVVDNIPMETRCLWLE